MSIREFLDEENAFNFPHFKLNKVTIGRVTHEERNNIYHIKDQNNTHLLSFDSNRNLHTSVVKDYCDAIDAKHNVNHGTHSVAIASINEQIASLAESVPTDENFEDLQTRVVALETYVTRVKHFMSALSQSVNLIDPDTSSAFDFTNLL